MSAWSRRWAKAAALCRKDAVKRTAYIPLKVMSKPIAMKTHSSDQYAFNINIAKGTTDPRVEFCLPK